MKRIFAGIIFFFLVLYAPFWLTLLYGTVVLLSFPRYYEFPVAALLVELLYRPSDAKFFGMLFGMTVCALLLLVVAEFVRKRIRVVS